MKGEQKLLSILRSGRSRPVAEVFLLLKVRMGTMVSQLLCHYGQQLNLDDAHADQLHSYRLSLSRHCQGHVDVAQPCGNGHGFLCWLH